MRFFLISTRHCFKLIQERGTNKKKINPDYKLESRVTHQLLVLEDNN